MKYLISLFTALILSGFFLKENGTQDRENPQVEEQVYLQADRTFYKPGEDIWFSAWIVDREQHMLTDLSEIIYVELINPKGKSEKKLKLLVKNGRANGDFHLSEELPGGIYKLRAYTLWMRNLGEDNYFERKLTVQKVILPNLLMKLKFLDKGYSAGDMAIAELDLKDLENKPLINKKFDYEVIIGGKKYQKKKSQTDENGQALIKFLLPEKLNSPDGVLNISIEHQGKTESISRTIPITLKDIELSFFPEGGNLVHSVNSRIAFKAIDKYGKPTDVEGKIYDSRGNVVSSFKSFHDGMGAFRLNPVFGNKYTAKIVKPNTLKASFELPSIEKNAYTLEVQQKDNQFITAIINSPQKTKIGLVGMIKGKTYFSTTAKAKTGANSYTIPIKDLPSGILKVTIKDKNDVEQCERLVFVNKNKLLNIEIKTEKEKYLPREKVTLDIKTTDYKGNAVAADIALSVVNNNLRTFADDKQDHILSSLLLCQELKGKVHEPRFYFDKDEPKANEALDYLLMTQGWRKFVWKDSADLSFIAEKAQIVGRLLDYNKTPFKNHKVWVVETNDSVMTDENGYFVFENIAINRRLTIRALDAKGYKTDYYVDDYVNYFITSDYIKGHVSNQENEPVKNARVYYPGTSIEALTDSKGNFSIPNIKNVSILRIESDLHKSRQIHVKNKNKLQIIHLYLKDIVSKSNLQNNENEKNNIEKEFEKLLIPEQIMQKPDPQQVEVLNIIDDEVEIEEEFIPMDAEADENSEIEIIEIVDLEVEEDVDEDIFCFVERMPEFPGGELNLRYYLTQNLKYPPQAREQWIEGKVYVRFMVSRTGNVEKVSIARGVDPILDNEAIRVVQSLPKWRPGQQRGKNVNVWYTVPVNFNLLNSDDRKPDGYHALIQVGGPNYMSGKGNGNGMYRARTFYAPEYDIDEKITERSDFRSTIYWNPQITTDENGRARVSFYNSDEITSFKAIAEGLSSKGVPGKGEFTYFTQLPFSVHAKLPAFLTFGDNLQVPVTLTNNTNKDISGKLSLAKMESLQIKDNVTANQVVKAKTNKTIWLDFTVLNIEGKQIFNLSFKNEGLSDAIKKEIMVLPKGFPVNQVFSSNDIESRFNFEVGEIIPGSLKAKFSAYPSILNDLMGGIESILREPYGCFEQTSSSTYPNLLVLDYMKSTGNITASIHKKALDLTDKGYKRLVGFETSENGYEWFGHIPAHEGLTAYGLMEFTDMAKVYEGVDSKMVKRTQDWLLSKRDGNGGFISSKGKYGFNGASDNLKNAYVVYALTESGYFDVGIEYQKAYHDAETSQDAYKAALLANTAFNLGKVSDGNKLLKIIELQIENKGLGNLVAKESIVRAYGKSLQVETASLYLLALLKSPNPNPSRIEKVVKYIAGSRGAYGGFGSTQATVLALKALTSFAKSSMNVKADGIIELQVNNKFSTKKGYSKSQGEPVVFENLQAYLKTGKNKVNVNIRVAKKAVPYSFSIQYNANVPASSGECILEMATQLNAQKVKMGDLVRMDINIKNIAEEYTPMAIAKVGIPSGLSLQPYQLKELLEKKKVDYYEIFDNYLVFYFTSLKPGQEVSIPLDLKTELPGSYEAPASSVYLYYTNEYKHWGAGEKIEIRR